MRDAATDTELVFSTSQTDIVGKLKQVRPYPSRISCELKAAGDVDTYDVRNVFIHLGSNCFRADGLRYYLILGRPGQRQAKRVHGGGTEQVRAAEREPKSFVVPAISSAQDVLIRWRDQIIFCRKQITSEQGMVGTRLIIELHNRLAVVVRISLAIRNFAARIGRLRKNRGEFDGCGTECLRIDAVIDERSLERHSPSRIACRGGKCRKVARKHCSRRNETTNIRWVLPDCRALITAKEKQFVLHYRSADGATELIALQCARFDREILARIEQIVAYKFKRVAVNLIRARLGHRADERAFSSRRLLSTEFGLELGERVWKW